MVLDVLGDAVYFELGFVDPDLGVGAGDGVDLSALLLLLEDGALADADGELDMACVTLFSEEKTCGERIFSLNLLLSIMI